MNFVVSWRCNLEWIKENIDGSSELSMCSVMDNMRDFSVIAIDCGQPAGMCMIHYVE